MKANRYKLISPPPNEVVHLILFALGKRTTTIFPLRDEFGQGGHLPLYKAARKEQDAKINEQENKINELNLQIKSLSLELKIIHELANLLTILFQYMLKSKCLSFTLIPNFR